MKLNLGCGNDYWDGWKNIDISKSVRADEYYDLTDGIEEDKDSIEEIHCGCMMEQIDSNKDFIYFLNECHRVLKTDGVLRGYVPSTDPRVLYLDPMDKRFFKLESFDYFDKTKNAWQQFGKNYGILGWSKTLARMAENGIIHFELIK